MRAPIFPRPTNPTFSDPVAAELDIHLENVFVTDALFLSARKFHAAIIVENCLYAIVYIPNFKNYSTIIPKKLSIILK